MSHGLRVIANATYLPYGTGRDWFFVGDYGYRHGRRTPGENDRKKAKRIDPPMKPRGPPRELKVAATARASARAPTTQLTCPDLRIPGSDGTREHAERWQRMETGQLRAAEAPSGLDAPPAPLQGPLRAKARRSSSTPATPARVSSFQTTYGDLGTHQAFDASGLDTKYERYRTFSMPVFPKEAPVDEKQRPRFKEEFDPATLEEDKYNHRFSEAVPYEKLSQPRVPAPVFVPSFNSSRLGDRYYNFSEGLLRCGGAKTPPAQGVARRRRGVPPGAFDPSTLEDDKYMYFSQPMWAPERVTR